MRVGTGLGSKIRTYAATVGTTFRQLESARTDDSVVVTIGTPVVLAAGVRVRTLDSSYTQGIIIRNPSTTVSLFIAGLEYDTLVCDATSSLTAFEILPGVAQRFDVRDGTGLCVGVLAATLTFKVAGN